MLFLKDHLIEKLLVKFQKSFFKLKLKIPAQFIWEETCLLQNHLAKQVVGKLNHPKAMFFTWEKVVLKMFCIIWYIIVYIIFSSIFPPRGNQLFMSSESCMIRWKAEIMCKSKAFVFQESKLLEELGTF